MRVMEQVQDTYGLPPAESVRDKIKADIKVWADLWGVPANARLVLRVLLLEPGFQLAFLIRMQAAVHAVPGIGVMLRRIVWYVTTLLFGCHIDPKTSIGGGIHFPHPTGIVLGGEVQVGRNVRILQGVTLGIVDDTKQCPVVEDGVHIYAGAKILGAIRLGAGCRIGANAVVLKDVPPGAVAVGVPAKVVTRRQDAAA